LAQWEFQLFFQKDSSVLTRLKEDERSQEVKWEARTAIQGNSDAVLQSRR
jgi:hypothetical protein